MVSSSPALLRSLLLLALCLRPVQYWQQLEDLLLSDGLQGPIADVVQVLTLRGLVLTSPVVCHHSPGAGPKLALVAHEGYL